MNTCSKINSKIFQVLFNKSLVALTTVLATLTLASRAEAVVGFTGAYADTNFTLSNSPATGDGSVDTTNAATGTIILTGSANDNPLSTVNTDWTITVSQAATIQFGWSFTGEGVAYIPNALGEQAGYVQNGSFTSLATNDATSASPVSLSLANGDTFAFRVETATNNSGGAAAFTVNSFEFTPVPFETDATLGLLTLGLFYAGYRWYKSILSAQALDSLPYHP
jgi:hypothetical protein